MAAALLGAGPSLPHPSARRQSTGLLRHGGQRAGEALLQRWERTARPPDPPPPPARFAPSGKGVKSALPTPRVTDGLSGGTLPFKLQKQM